MIQGIPLLIVGGLIIAIWAIIEVKRFKHKVFAMLLIILIIFTYTSFTVTLKGNSIGPEDLKTMSGIVSASKLYLSWLSSIFGNLKLITLNAIKMDWKGNETIRIKEIQLDD